MLGCTPMSYSGVPGVPNNFLIQKGAISEKPSCHVTPLTANGHEAHIQTHMGILYMYENINVLERIRSKVSACLFVG